MIGRSAKKLINLNTFTLEAINNCPHLQKAPCTPYTMRGIKVKEDECMLFTFWAFCQFYR